MRPTSSNLVPADGRFVEIDEHLFRFKVFFQPPGAEFAAEARLLVAAPGRFDVSRLHVIDPDDAGTERLHDAEGLVDVTRPNSSSKPVWRVVGDTDGFGFPIEGNHGRHRAEDFLASNTSSIFNIIKDGWLYVVASAELLRAASTGSDLGFRLAELKIGADAVILFFADERSHFCFAFERRAELDALGLFRHGLDKFGIDFLLDEDAAARGTHFALINEYAEERAIDGRFPVRVSKENIWRFAAEFERDAFERVCSALDDDLADRGASGESNFVDTGMRDERGARSFTEAIDDVHHAGRQANLREPVRGFERGQWGLLGRLENARAAGRKCGREFPCGHEQRIVPRNNLAGHSHWLAERETQRVGGNWIDAAENFVCEAAIVFEAGGDVRDVVFRFDDRFAGVATFDFREQSAVV